MASGTSSPKYKRVAVISTALNWFKIKDLRGRVQEMSLVVQMAHKASKNNNLGSDKLSDVITLDVSEGHS